MATLNNIEAGLLSNGKAIDARKNFLRRVLDYKLRNVNSDGVAQFMAEQEDVLQAQCVQNGLPRMSELDYAAFVDCAAAKVATREKNADGEPGAVTVNAPRVKKTAVGFTIPKLPQDLTQRGVMMQELCKAVHLQANAVNRKRDEITRLTLELAALEDMAGVAAQVQDIAVKIGAIYAGLNAIPDFLPTDAKRMMQGALSAELPGLEAQYNALHEANMSKTAAKEDAAKRAEYINITNAFFALHPNQAAVGSGMSDDDKALFGQHLQEQADEDAEDEELAPEDVTIETDAPDEDATVEIVTETANTPDGKKGKGK